MKGIYRVMGIASGVALCFTGAVHAQAYPTKPIRMIVPFSAGGPTDAMARDLALRMATELGQPVVVENRPGAGGNIGADMAAKSAPDGYTLLFATNGPLAGNPSLYKNIGYDPIKSFAPITNYAIIGNILAVHPSFPAHTLADLLKLLKANPDKYSYASGGSGTTQHFAGELVKAMGGVKMTHISYKGEGPAVLDTLGNQVPMVFCNFSSCLQHIQSGKLLAVAVTSPKRNPALPNVPSIAEALPGFDMRAWYGLVTVANTPPAIVKRLNEVAVKIISSPEVTAKIRSYGGEPRPSSAEEYGQFIRSEVQKWDHIVKVSGATVD
ncbi:tripartite tricarboxylate transporter substrate binding protein [Imbroritus primus]|uniref:Tripartite tricarboxylate transporter substrate binding protein n=1 Tax=Imbroritus primus TaxID=3058603 RepID=A0ACD3SPR9_9BURK|nr:tripartite tricarboxylate transporter substrate binding protein [Burkholderiaceae bacterium PBA]